MKRLNPAVKFVCLMVLTFVLAFRWRLPKLSPVWSLLGAAVLGWALA